MPPAALQAVLASLRTGGLTGAERAKIKADKRAAEREEERREAAEGMSAEVRTAAGQRPAFCLLACRPEGGGGGGGEQGGRGLDGVCLCCVRVCGWGGFQKVCALLRRTGFVFFSLCRE